MPRLSAVLELPMLNEVIAKTADKTFQRMIYAGNIVAELKVTADKFLMTFLTTAFDATDASNAGSPIEKLRYRPVNQIKLNSLKSKKPHQIVLN